MEVNDGSNNMFSWTTFYSEFADKLLPFKNNRTELLKLINNAYESIGMKNPFIDNGSPMDDICPFTVFGCFNKGITEENRIAIKKITNFIVSQNYLIERGKQPWKHLTRRSQPPASLSGLPLW